MMAVAPRLLYELSLIFAAELYTKPDPGYGCPDRLLRRGLAPGPVGRGGIACGSGLKFDFRLEFGFGFERGG